MELKTVEIIVYILIPILTAVLGGWEVAYSPVINQVAVGKGEVIKLSTNNKAR